MTEKPRLTFEEELLDLQRAQFNLAKGRNRNLGLIATIVAFMFILYIIGEVLSCVAMRWAY